jgi:DNA-directed RNA polymerase subunit M/transcription elongation factor TFIIS
MNDDIPAQSCRKNGYNLFKKLLDTHANKTKEKERIALAINLERGVFNACVKKTKGLYWNSNFKNAIYIPTFLHIYSNLNPSNNVGNCKLLPRLLSNEFTIDYLCQEMSSEEMFPERYIEFYKEQDEELAKIERQKRQVEGACESLHKCGKCKSKKTTYYEMQTRSADEPMTVFISCLVCGNKWRY